MALPVRQSLTALGSGKAAFPNTFSVFQFLESPHDSLKIFRKWDSDVPKLKR
jgi:hypothetical protein